MCTRDRDGADARPVQRGGSQSELVSVSKWSDGMHMHTAHAHMPHKRTSLEAPPRVAERLVAAAAAVAACPRPLSVVPRPSVAKAATIERPVRVEEGTGQHVVAGRLGRRVAEFGPWWLPRTSMQHESLPSLFTSVEELEVIVPT